MLTDETLKIIVDLPWEVKDEWGELYKRDSRALKSINKALETKYKAVYRKASSYKATQLNAKELDIDTGYTYIVTSTNRVLLFSNSEWFTIEGVK